MSESTGEVLKPRADLFETMKEYHSPSLRAYGRVRDLTQSNPGRGADGSGDDQVSGVSSDDGHS